MIRQATFDPSRRLDLYFRISRNGEKTFTFLDANGGDFDITGINFELFIKDHPGSRAKVISLTIGDGLEIPVYETNILNASVTDVETFLNEGEYYWELYLIDEKKTWLSGNAFFHNGKFDGINNSAGTITINEGGETIEITIDTTVSTGGGGVQSIVAGANITVDDTDPQNPIVSSTAGGSQDLQSVLDQGSSGLIAGQFDVTSQGASDYSQISTNENGAEIANSNNANTEAVGIQFASDGIKVTDTRVDRGLQGTADYSANIQANDYTQKGYVDTLVSAEALARSSADALKANISSPTFTGTPTAPTATEETNSTQLATTAFVRNTTVGSDLYLYTIAF